MLAILPPLLLSSLLPVLAVPWSTNIIHCGSLPPPPPNPADCHRAIASIPSGTFIFDPARPGSRLQSHPIDVHFPSRHDRRRILLPAAFRAATCTILIHSTRTGADPARFPVLAHPPPAKAASATYAALFPNVRRWTNAIVGECVPREQQAGMPLPSSNETANMGVVKSFSLLGELGYRFEYYVTVMGRGEGVEREGEYGRVEFVKGPFAHVGVRYHVYMFRGAFWGGT